MAEACHQGIASIDELNDRFAAWAAQVANRRRHAETGQAPIERFEAGGPPRQANPARLAEAFRWSVTRKVTRTATVPLQGNAYGVDPALVGRRVELRYDPEDLTRIEVFCRGASHGHAQPHVISRHCHPKVKQAPQAVPAVTGIDYLQLLEDKRATADGAACSISYAGLAPAAARPDREEASDDQ